MKSALSIILVLVACAAVIAGCDGSGGGHGSNAVTDTISGYWWEGVWYANTTGLTADARPLPADIEGEYRYSVWPDNADDDASDDADDDGVPSIASGSMLALQDSEHPSWVRLVFEPDAGTQFPVEFLEGTAWEQVTGDTGVAFTACELGGINLESDITVTARLVFYDDELYGEIEVTDANGLHQVSVLTGELGVLPLSSSLELIIATLP